MTSDADVAARIARQRALALEHAAATTCASLACAPPRAWDDARALIEASTTAQRQRAETRARVDAWREARRIDDARWLAVGWLGLYHLETSNTRWPKRVSKARLCVFAAAWSRAYA